MKLIHWLFSYNVERQRLLSGNKRETFLHDAVLFLLFFSIAISGSIFFSNVFEDNSQFSVPVFILNVCLIARFTHGYLCGIIASIFGVFCVNYMFTYPYWEFNMSITGYPLTFAAMLMVSICISTLTTRIKKQEQLFASAEIEKMRANLLRSVSHDLRTPLTSIVGSSSVLLQDDALSDDQRRELILEINKDARWLTRITENILSVTKFSGSKISLHKEAEVVEEIVSSAIVKFKRNHPEIAVSVNRPDDILLAPMDATLIEQVLLNLFDNAVVHGKTTTRILITLSERQETICILISDNGCGIPQYMLPHLFDGTASFYKNASDEHRNMGIGLSVCQSILRAHSGSIQVLNNEYGGASFLIQLPAEEVKHYEQTQE